MFRFYSAQPGNPATLYWAGATLSAGLGRISKPKAAGTNISHSDQVWLITVSLAGNVKNIVASRFPWPTVVAVMLLFCSFLIVLGIRKWCQYQKEM